MGYLLKNIVNSPFKGLDYSYISSDYGSRAFYNNVTGMNISDFHDGIDMTSGNYVVAYADGKVIESRNNVTGYSEVLASGNYVKIDHGNGLFSIYAHMKYGSVTVSVGQQVQKGQIIGQVGATGFATGAHLHFGICKNGKWVDPKPYMLKTEEVENNNDTEEYDKYYVKYGDTLSGIAFTFKTTVSELVKINNISNPNLILVGQEILIPKNSNNNLNTNKYTVRPGDNLSSIATLYGTTWQNIYEKNKNIIGSNPNLILPGMELEI